MVYGLVQGTKSQGTTANAMGAIGYFEACSGGVAGVVVGGWGGF